MESVSPTNGRRYGMVQAVQKALNVVAASVIMAAESNDTYGRVRNMALDKDYFYSIKLDVVLALM